MKPAGSPGLADPTRATPTRPPHVYHDAALLHGGLVALPGYAPQPVTPGLRVTTPKLEATEFERWLYLTAHDGSSLAALYDEPSESWLTIGSGTSMPDMAAPPVEPRFDPAAHKVDYAVVRFGDSLTVPLHTWRIDRDGNVITDDNRQFPASMVFEETLPDGVTIGRYPSGHVCATTVPPTVYYQHAPNDDVHDVFLVPRTPPTLTEKLRRERVPYTIATVLVSLFFAFVAWVGGVPALLGVLYPAALFLWFLHYRPLARPMERDFFAGSNVSAAIPPRHF